VSFVRALLGSPWKTIIRYLHIASDWDTISHDLEMYRAEIKDRDEWIAAIKARHREQEETLRQQAEAWARVADRSIALAEGQAGKLEETRRLLDQTRQQFISLVGDYIDSTMLLTVKLHWESPEAQRRQLSLLEPTSRAVIEAVLSRLPAADSDALPDFADLKGTIIREALRLTAPPTG
jgi:hypothetical protein